VDYSLGIVNHDVIDEINILEATKLAMKQAVESLTVKPDFLLIDALTLSGITLPQRGVIKGDSLSVSIAAASIVAKVTRDRMMQELHEKYPYYAFDRNKGYGTKAHYEGLAQKGPTPVHRMTFLKNLQR